MSNIDKQAVTAKTKELASLMVERFSMNPVSCKLLNEAWKKEFPDEVAIAERMLALLYELEHYKSREERVTKLVLDNSTSWDALYKKLEAAEKRIAGLSKAASVNNHWKPDVCPITGRKFFMWIEHEKLGYVPTYGGPFDSYTIPTRDSSGEFSCERYDHDIGGWVDGEFIGLYLIDDDEQCRVCELKERIAELEAKLETADKLQDGAFRDGLKAGFSYGQTDDQSGFTQCMSAYSPHADIKVKGE
ncbi:ead/Ea22-like family protein [Salmonella enterica]|nr:ead/Ea22-like family protein [Salmonella enterica subsp. enterica serovar Braenderup]EEP4278988.1 ead/Ea22-like family protein [Salmonella enterica subsp. enterica serovar Potsdam]EHI3017671.1 ead/Ea22-like family protein [Salmonella enterica]EEU8181002.1 ead/Ea22-like family protein [Salmonella enterica subsp. enterica serovar Potsdam]EGH2495885.1 ead/Ea22-like family protein [Salmonella enterica subsp. enterica serovar Braenderup]